MVSLSPQRICGRHQYGSSNRGLCEAANFYGIFVDNVLICLGVALFVIYVPSQKLKNKVNELPAEAGFRYIDRTICLAVCIKSFNEFGSSCGTDIVYIIFKKKFLGNTLFLRTTYIFQRTRNHINFFIIHRAHIQENTVLFDPCKDRRGRVPEFIGQFYSMYLFRMNAYKLCWDIFSGSAPPPISEKPSTIERFMQTLVSEPTLFITLYIFPRLSQEALKSFLIREFFQG